MTTNLSRHGKGFTLVELMIAMVLGLIVVGGSLALFISQRVTNRLSGEMVDVQSDGRLILDAMARDVRAAGDFGCWPVANPIDGRLNKMVFDVNKGGVFGYDTKVALSASNAANAPYGLDTVNALGGRDINSSVLILSGINGTLTRLAADMGTEADDLTVKTPLAAFKAKDVAVITDCINWAKFQVTEVKAGSVADTTMLAHVGGVLSDAWGNGNKDGNLGAVFRNDSSVGRFDSVWWFVATINNAKGLYRMSARDAVPVLVSKRIYAMQITYDIAEVVDNGVVKASGTGKKASDLKATDWPQVRSLNIQVLVQSEKTADGGGKTAVSDFAGVAVPADNHVYLPLQINVALRNQ